LNYVTNALLKEMVLKFTLTFTTLPEKFKSSNVFAKILDKKSFGMQKKIGIEFG
jgi:hypothetical protein